MKTGLRKKPTLCLVLMMALCGYHVAVATPQPIGKHKQLLVASKIWLKRHRKKIALAAAAALVSCGGAYGAYRLLKRNGAGSLDIPGGDGFAPGGDHSDDDILSVALSDSDDDGFETAHSSDEDEPVVDWVSDAVSSPVERNQAAASDARNQVGGGVPRVVVFRQDERPFVRRNHRSLPRDYRCSYQLFHAFRRVERDGPEQLCGAYGFACVPDVSWWALHLADTFGGLTPLLTRAMRRVMADEGLPQQWREGDFILQHEFVGGEVRARGYVGDADYLAHVRQGH